MIFRLKEEATLLAARKTSVAAQSQKGYIRQYAVYIFFGMIGSRKSAALFVVYCRETGKKKRGIKQSKNNIRLTKTFVTGKSG